jgi:putative redox protein
MEAGTEGAHYQREGNDDERAQRHAREIEADIAEESSPAPRRRLAVRAGLDRIGGFPALNNKSWDRNNGEDEKEQRKRSIHLTQQQKDDGVHDHEQDHVHDRLYSRSEASSCLRRHGNGAWIRMVDANRRRVDVALIEGMHFEATAADGVSVSVDAPSAPGSPPAGPSPMEMLLIGLGGCTGMDVISILRKKRQQVTAYRVEVSAEMSTEYPHVYTEIAIRHVVQGSGLSEEAVRHSIELSETKYCGAHAMLGKAAAISSTYEIQEAPAAG